MDILPVKLMQLRAGCAHENCGHWFLVHSCCDEGRNYIISLSLICCLQVMEAAFCGGQSH